MPKYPVAKPRETIKAIKKAGFAVDHVTGSHYVLFNEDKSLRVTIAYHNKPIKRKTLKSILEQARLSIEEFNKLR